MEELFSHHAVCIEGESSRVLPEIEKALRKRGIEITGSPDFFMLETETLGIDEVREVVSRAGQRGLIEGGKWFVVSFASATREAQNALLKTIEEPGEGTHFIFITPDASRLLPTLRSRLHIVRADVGEVEKNVKEFFKAALPVRLKQLEPLIREKDRAGALAFMRDLERGVTTDMLRTSPDFVHDLIRFRDYLGDRGSSVKLILEYIAHTAPKI